MKVKAIILLFTFVLLIYAGKARQQGGGVQPPHPTARQKEGLSPEEAERLNALLANIRGDFDFQGKKAAFLTGSNGSRILTKTIFFETCIDPWTSKGEKPDIAMVLLTPAEKNTSGGYDVLVLSWVKVFTHGQKGRTIHALSSAH